MHFGGRLLGVIARSQMSWECDKQDGAARCTLETKALEEMITLSTSSDGGSGGLDMSWTNVARCH